MWCRRLYVVLSLLTVAINVWPSPVYELTVCRASTVRTWNVTYAAITARSSLSESPTYVKHCPTFVPTCTLLVDTNQTGVCCHRGSTTLRSVDYKVTPYLEWTYRSARRYTWQRERMDCRRHGYKCVQVTQLAHTSEGWFPCWLSPNNRDVLLHEPWHSNWVNALWALWGLVYTVM